jgi:valyl-tRNA synthetase
MEQKQYEDIKKLLEEIRDLLATTQSQPSTKITVVGNGQGQKTTKGLKSDEDFFL